MIETNEDRVITMSVMGVVISPSYPGIPAIPHQIDREGKPRLLPALGGIVYNVKVGDSVYGWAGDMIEPGVAIKSPDPAANEALNVFACVGNDAVVMSGNATGAKGVVTGKSGRFAEHVIIHFAPEVLDQLAFGDKIVVHARGVGLAVNRFPGVFLKSLSPLLFDRLRLEENDGKLTVPVTAIVPPELMGAGAGLTSEGGAICIQSMDTAALARHGLDKLRLGDVVAITRLRFVLRPWLQERECQPRRRLGHRQHPGRLWSRRDATDDVSRWRARSTDRRRDQHRQPARLRGEGVTTDPE